MRRWLGLLALIGLAACDDPTPGQLLVVLESPNADDGAIEIAVTSEIGFRVDDVAATCRGCRIFTRVVSEQDVRAVVTGPIADGLFITLTVSDTRKPDRYTISIISGASRSYDVRSSMAGYTVRLAR